MYPRTVLVSVLVMVVVQSLGRELPPRDIVSESRRTAAVGKQLPPGTTMDEFKQAVKYFKRYGYQTYDTSKTDTSGGLNVNITTELRLLQEFMGLPVTMTLDDETMAVIGHTRCGAKDPVGVMASLYRNQAHMQSFTLLGGKWNKSDITYRITGQNSVNGFTRKRLAEVVREAFDVYTPHVPLTFTQVPKKSPSDILIQFRSIDNDPNMDGRGKSVGCAYPPLAGTDQLGMIYIDADEDYANEGPEGTPLLAVLVHQIGHALGLGHASTEDSVMKPCVPPPSSEVHLGQSDIDALNQLYGLDSFQLPEENALCTITSYDAVTVMDGFLYVFSGERFWKLTTSGSLLSPSEGVPISRVWSEVQGDVDVVFENSLGHVVIMKGGKYYEYDVTGILFPWAPKATRDMDLPKNAEAGYSIARSSFFIRGGRLWFMDEATTWFMDEASRVVHPDSPKSIRSLWKVTVDHADSAFLLDDYLYILQGQDYIRLQASTAEQVAPPDSMNFARDFLGC